MSHCHGNERPPDSDVDLELRNFENTRHILSQPLSFIPSFSVLLERARMSGCRDPQNWDAHLHLERGECKVVGILGPWGWDERVFLRGRSKVEKVVTIWVHFVEKKRNVARGRPDLERSSEARGRPRNFENGPSVPMDHGLRLGASRRTDRAAIRGGHPSRLLIHSTEGRHGKVNDVSRSATRPPGRHKGREAGPPWTLADGTPSKLSEDWPTSDESPSERVEYGEREQSKRIQHQHPDRQQWQGPVRNFICDIEEHSHDAGGYDDGESDGNPVHDSPEYDVRHPESPIVVEEREAEEESSVDPKPNTHQQKEASSRKTWTDEEGVTYWHPKVVAPKPKIIPPNLPLWVEPRPVEPQPVEQQSVETVKEPVETWCAAQYAIKKDKKGHRAWPKKPVKKSQPKTPKVNLQPWEELAPDGSVRTIPATEDEESLMLSMFGEAKTEYKPRYKPEDKAKLKPAALTEENLRLGLVSRRETETVSETPSVRRTPNESRTEEGPSAGSPSQPVVPKATARSARSYMAQAERMGGQGLFVSSSSESPSWANDIFPPSELSTVRTRSTNGDSIFGSSSSGSLLNRATAEPTSLHAAQDDEVAGQPFSSPDRRGLSKRDRRSHSSYSSGDELLLQRPPKKKNQKKVDTDTRARFSAQFQYGSSSSSSIAADRSTSPGPLTEDRSREEHSHNTERPHEIASRFGGPSNRQSVRPAGQDASVYDAASALDLNENNSDNVATDQRHMPRMTNRTLSTLASVFDDTLPPHMGGKVLEKSD